MKSTYFWGDGKIHMRFPNSVCRWFQGAVNRQQEIDNATAEEVEPKNEGPGPIFPRVTSHDLRHTAASLAISAGANVKAVQRMLRHASAAMTLDVYGDLFDDDLDDVATALNQARTSAVVANMLPASQIKKRETPAIPMFSRDLRGFNWR